MRLGLSLHYLKAVIWTIPWKSMKPCMSSTLHVKVRLKMCKEMPMDRLRQMTILDFNGG